MSYASDRRKEFFALIESFEAARARGYTRFEWTGRQARIDLYRALNRSASKVLPG